MTPANGLHGQPQRAQQRPLYVASPASQHIPTKAASTPIRSMSSTSSVQQNSLASPSTPHGRSTGDVMSQHAIAAPAAARRPQASPSAYDRFDEVSWIVDLSSRIGNALQSPPRSSAKASAIGSQSPASSPAHLRARNRVRLPRPSREFRDLQHKIQLSHASTSASALADTAPDLSASFDADDSAVEWAQHAQQDFERRRADLERSRQAILKHLEGDDQHGDADDEERASEAIAKASVDPAVERSMLAARSLQELMRSGGLQNEDGDDASPGFADLLANAEPLPGGAELGPSSLFEANRGSDGTLDIESILQQRAKLAALTDHEQEGPSRPQASMFDLSQSAPKPPPKRPVIEVLGTDNPRPASKAKTSSEDADQEQELAHREASERAHSSDQSSSESSTESDDSNSSEDSDSESDQEAEAAAGTVQARSGEQSNAAPRPMDQIAIVNGEFRILPAAHPERTLGQQQSPDLDGDNTAASSADEDSDQDDRMDSASDDQASDDAADDDEDDEMDDDGERAYAADPAQNRYHDGFGGVSTRNLLFDGPVGDADEPIVLSDSDEDDDAGEDQENREQDDEEEMDEDNQDELADESEEEQQSDEDAQSHYGRPQLAAAPLSDDEHEHEEEEDEGEEEDLDDSQEAIGQFHPPAPSIPLDANRTLIGLDEDGMQQLPLPSTSAPAPMAPDASQGKTSLQQGDSDDSDQEGDAMPDSEVEPEEFDEDLRWSDMEAEAEQPIDQEPAHAQFPASTSVDTAFRASQGSQPMPGFVTASQLFANIQAAESEVDAQQGFSAADALQTAGPIDPQLLASLEDAVSTEVEAAAAAETKPLPADTSPTQTETDIFDAFTRQDASSSAQEPHVTETAEAVPTLQANSEESQDGVGAEGETGDTAIEESPVIARTDASEQPEQVVSEALDRSNDAPETEDPAPQTEDPTERAKVEEQNGDAVHSPRPIDATKDAVSAIVGASELSASQGQAALSVELQAEDIPAAVEASADAEDEGMDEPIELIKPVLARVESTDVLEADVEDNSEDEAAIEETAAPGSDSVPPLPTAALSADPTSEALVVEADDISHGGSHASATGGEQPAETFISVALEASQPHIIIDAHEEEGILSGDLADRDSSIERQPLPSSTATSRVSPVIKDEKIDEHASEDALHTESQPSPTSGAHVEPEKAERSSVQDENVTERVEEPVEHTGPPMVDGSLSQTAESGSEVTHSPTEPPTVSGSKEQSKNGKASDVSVTASLSTLLPNRVPPSPASSDRRSGSSFTPSANRQGNRHLHGAAKRNLFAQMTEAASNLASNLTAPLRAIPSLLPISENQAEESRADDRDAPTTSTTEDDAQDSSPVGSQGQQKRATKSSDASEYTITTRSHCICRRLQLNKIEGAPIFIVPGCSINYEEARLEDAEDLGKTSEQKSNDWIDVDPDFLPPDVHHMLSRIIGLQMMCEICVEPDSTAAKMIFAGFDLDADLLTSFDDDDKERVAKHHSTGDEALAKAEVGDGVEAKEPETEINVEAGAIEETHQEDPETPSHIARQSPRHRRASSVASASSHHRSPRRSDPMSANADYLPDDERRILQKGRHPQAAASGDVSIASLEEQVQDEEDEDDADLDARILPKAQHSAEEGEGRDVEEEPTSLVSPPQEPKRKRGRPRKSAAADTSYKPSAQDAQEADEDDAEPSAESKPRKGRGRKRAASEDASGKAQASDNKDAQDAAAVEDVLDAVASTPKRARRGRKSRDTAAFDPREGQQSEDEEKEGTENTGSPVRTRATRDNKGAVEQQVGGEDEEESKPEAEEKSKARKGGRGGRKRKQAADEPSNAAAEASAVDKVAKTGEGQTAKQPRRSRRSQGGSQTPSTSPSKTSPRKSPKRKVLKLN